MGKGEFMNDKLILRELAKRYMDAAQDPVQTIRRNDWRKHNSLQQSLPLIYIRAFAWGEMPEAKCICSDPFYREYENYLRYRLFWYDLHDDSVFEPWITLPAIHKCYGWGVAVDRKISETTRGSFKVDYALKEPEDINKLRKPYHEIDEERTSANYAKIADAIGDIIPVSIDRSPAYKMWSGDISTDLGYLRGIENFMLDMVTEPEWLHQLSKFMSDGILETHIQAEKAGDWGLDSHQNQSMAYAEELPDPQPNSNGIQQKQLWGYMAAQEFACVSPAMHEEFLLKYQLPILNRFGLVAYGCCEDLTNKIEMLKQIPNLRRIAVSPFANVSKCAEQIEKNYVLSYRPSPSDMVGYGFDENRITDILMRDLSACRNSVVDITLKDVETVQYDQNRVKNWIIITRNIIEKIWG